MGLFGLFKKSPAQPYSPYKDDAANEIYNLLFSHDRNEHPKTKELLAVIVELGLEKGLDVLASFHDGTARYINQTGKILVWETTEDAKANELTNDLFEKSRQILQRIGRGNNQRLPYPSKGNARITFLASDGLSFGEGPIEALFNDPLANPALISATQLMQYLTEKSLSSQETK